MSNTRITNKQTRIEPTTNGDDLLTQFDYLYSGFNIDGTHNPGSGVSYNTVSNGIAMISGSKVEIEGGIFSNVNNNHNIIVIDKDTHIMSIRYSRTSDEIYANEILVYSQYIDSWIESSEQFGPTKPITRENIDINSLLKFGALNFQSGWGWFAGHRGSIARDGNTVHLYGLVAKTSSVAAGEIIAYLPEGFLVHPDIEETSLIYRTATDAALSANASSFSIHLDGTIRTRFASAANVWIGLTGASYVGEKLFE